MTPVDNRLVVKCECGLVQFETANGKCRKPSCCQPYRRPEPEPGPEPAIIRKGVEIPALKAAPLEAPNTALLGDSLRHVLRVIREAKGLSQKRLGIRMQCGRTFVAKMENGYVVPNLSTILRFCSGLDIRPDALMKAVEIGAR